MSKNASLWAPLMPAAMVGTARHAAAWPALPGEVGALAAESASNAEPADALLRMAAVLATCSLAGAQGHARIAALPTPSAPDTLPALPPGAALDAARWSLNDGPPRMQHLLCRALETAGLRLPEALLPLMLTLAQRSLALRSAMLPVLGERGLWLAAQHEDWKQLAVAVDESNIESHWTDGTLAQRLAFLARERAASPAAARERLQTALRELSAKERAEFVPLLAIGLGAEDEALLDVLCADRSREVRQAAQNLMLQLPQAARSQRAVARVAALLKFERVLLRKRWVVDAPTAAAGDWKAEGIEATRPQNESLGERAWWLYQLVRQVPLHWWTKHTELEPAQLIEWASGTDWAEALQRAWVDVLLAVPNDAWCEAFLARWPKALGNNVQVLVFARLSPARREHLLLAQLRADGNALAPVISSFVNTCPAGELLPRETSLGLSEQLVKLARQQTVDERPDLLNLIPEFACTVHGDALATLSALLPLATRLQSLEQILVARRALLTLMNPSSSRTP